MLLRVKGLGVAAAAFAGLMATSAYAIQPPPPNLVKNGSFEDTTNFANGSHVGDDTLQQASKAMPGWTVVGFGEVGWFSPDVNLPATNYDITASDGDYSLDLTGNTDSNGGFGGVAQTLNTVAGQSYHLTFDLGSDGQYGVPVAIEITAGDLDATATSSAVNGRDSNANIWVAQSFDFIASSGKTVLTFQGAQGHAYIGLDNVAVTGPAGSATPEPAAWALMLIGFGGIGGLLRQRRAQRAFAGV